MVAVDDGAVFVHHDRDHDAVGGNMALSTSNCSRGPVQARVGIFRPSYFTFACGVRSGSTTRHRALCEVGRNVPIVKGFTAPCISAFRERHEAMRVCICC